MAILLKMKFITKFLKNNLNRKMILIIRAIVRIKLKKKVKRKLSLTNLTQDIKNL